MLIRSNYLEHFSWVLILVILFFQSVLQKYSIISNAALVLIAIQQFSKMSKMRKRYFLMTFVWILLLVGYSILLGNQPESVFRFSIVLLLIIYAYLWKVDNVFFISALFWSSFMLVFGLIILEAYMFSLSKSEYMLLRNQFFIANNMGDVFWWDIYYKLELRGTPLIVFVYMLSYSIDIFPTRYKNIIRVLYFVATIFAGNFAYQLALLLFHVAFYIQSSVSTPKLFLRRVLALLFISLVIGGVLIAYITSQMETKKEGSAQTRVDQVEVLFKDVAQNPITLLLGSGLGHTIDEKTQMRDYRNNTYFEVQTMYIFNQLGLVNFTFLVLMNFFLAFRYVKYKELLLIYAVYTVYASTNPYIWDTNHVVVITALVCANSYMKATSKRFYPKEVKVIA